MLSGVKPWCSLAAQLDAALVTAHVGDGRQLFRVSLRHPSVTPEPPAAWVARGLRNVTSAAVRFDGTPARPVGAPGWYLSRPGFAWGGIGVAACWHGGARGVQATLARASARRTGDLAALHVGIVDAELQASEAVLGRAAALIDAGDAEGSAGEILGCGCGRWSPGRPSGPFARPGTRWDRLRSRSMRITRGGWPILSSTCVSIMPSVTWPGSAMPCWPTAQTGTRIDPARRGDRPRRQRRTAHRQVPV